VLTALAVLRGTDRDVVIVGPEARIGPGVAFATNDDRHLANSRAGTMSVDRNEPDGFVTWCLGRGHRLERFSDRPLGVRDVRESAGS
jgi:uncharacterized NAD(P)/FAD-binding protein YdhS